MTGYNYDQFSTGDYDFGTTAGPQVGEKAPDVEVAALDGETRRLLDVDGDFLVLEMGSITCPLFQGRRPRMERIEQDFRGVSSAVLYVREAHPGADIPSHRGMDDKIACARRLRDEDGESRTILVDDFGGDAHSAFGGMPNAVFIINRNGCVVFRSDWNNPMATRKAVAALVDGRPVKAKSYFKPVTPMMLMRILGRAGRGSTADFLRGLPALIWANLIKRNLRILFGRAPEGRADLTC